MFPQPPALSGTAILSGAGVASYPLSSALEPGEYQLAFGYSANDYYPMIGAGGSYGVDFAAVPAPEPSSGLVLLSAAALVGRRTRLR